MAINGSKKITDLSFEDIRTNLQTYLQAQDRFKDYDFNGSGLSILLDTLAYNTQYQSFYTNMVANEMFMDSAVKRESVVSHAKQLGYTPHSRKSPEARVQLSFSASDGDSIVVPAKTTFSANVNSTVYNFINDSPIVIGSTGDAPHVSEEFSIYEGSYSTISYVVSPTSDTKYVIPSNRIDTDHITVRVLASTTDTTGSNTRWSKVTDITKITATSNAYFLTENPRGFYEIKFGDNIIGKKLDNGNLVVIEYLETSGPVANGIGRTDVTTNRTFTTTLDNSTVSVVSSAAGGSDVESITSVRENSPRFYQTQDRAVTTNDYRSLVLANYGDADDVTVFGGEDFDPPKYGKVYISVKPTSNTTLTKIEKDNIKKDILEEKNVVGVIPEIIDPEYTYLKFQSKFSYDKTLTEQTSESLRSLILVYLSLYSAASLSKFGKNLYVNRLEEQCRSLDPSLNYVDVDIKLQKRLAPELNKTKNYVLEFRNSLLNTVHDDIDGKTGTPAVVSTPFAYKKEDGTIFLAEIDCDMDGNLRIFERSGDQKTIIFSNIGTIDFANGIVTINNFSPLSASRDGTIRFNVTPREDVVYTVTNNILTFDSTDDETIQVEYSADATRKVDYTAVISSGSSSTGEATTSITTNQTDSSSTGY